MPLWVSVQYRFALFAELIVEPPIFG